jgi:16S rRNA processing protein RimM
MTTSTQYAIVGRVRKAQGIRGQVTVELLTDNPETVFARGARVFAGTVDGDLARHPGDRKNPESRQELVVEETSPFKGGLIVKFDAIPDRTQAELWRHRYLLVPVEELTPPGEGEIFIHELIGMTVQGTDATKLGDVVGYYELPQGLTLEVKTAKGTVLLPYREEAVLEVDREARTLTVDAGSGLFD